MQLSIRQDRLFNGITVVCILLTAFCSLKLYFTWALPLTAVAAFSLFSCILYITLYKRIQFVSTFKIELCIILTIVFLYEILLIAESILSALVTLIGCFICCFIIISENKEKNDWLSYLIKATQIFTTISLIGWIVFLLGYPLPSYFSQTDVYYAHTVYYLFLLNGLPGEQLIPRFAGFFMEPGHLGTTCCLMLYINKFNLKHLGNIVLLLAVLFSLSLAAYGLLIGGIGLYFLFSKKRGLWYLFFFGISVVLIWIISYNYQSGDNYLYMKIFSRLEFVDGEMVGNNRTTNFFDTIFTKFLDSTDIWTGVGKEAFNSRGATGILYGCAGWQRYFYLRGIIGTFLILLFLLAYLRKFYSKLGLGFFILYVVTNGIRDYPLKEYWLFLYLMALPILRVRTYDNIYKL